MRELTDCVWMLVTHLSLAQISASLSYHHKRVVQTKCAVLLHLITAMPLQSANHESLSSLGGLFVYTQYTGGNWIYFPYTHS